MEIKYNDIVVFLDKPQNDPDRYARVNSVLYEKVWLTNLNMPYYGTISEIYTFKELEHMNIEILKS